MTSICYFSHPCHSTHIYAAVLPVACPQLSPPHTTLDPPPTAAHSSFLPECSPCPHTHRLHMLLAPLLKAVAPESNTAHAWFCPPLPNPSDVLLHCAPWLHGTQLAPSTTAALLLVWKTPPLLIWPLGQLLSPSSCVPIFSLIDPRTHN